ncbi:MAG TPA: DUF2062 domain-containing protein [Polyangiaceae bacterium]|nr:DUF2062 domain-containing protein [Polyangiaceae bacterium]
MSSPDGRRSPGRLRQKFSELVRRLRGGELSRARAAMSVAVGLFIGCLPVYGLHFVLCLLVCLPLRLDLLVAYLAANISNPLIAPLLLVLEVETGALLLTGRSVPFNLDQARQTGIAGFAQQAALGSLVVGSVLAALGAALTSLVVRPGAGERALNAAIRRTSRRYRAAPIADRIYVSIKLRTDPLAAQLARMQAPFGRILDVGCGRGQFGVLLLELERAESVLGFDWDERKIAAARAASEPGARFTVADARSLELPAVDTVLVLDVLHYLKREEQTELFARLTAQLPAGGRLLIRDVDERGTARSRLTRFFEAVATRIGYNRAGTLHFRAASELVAELRALGFSCSMQAERAPGPLANVLIVATRDGTEAACDPDQSARTSTVTESYPSDRTSASTVR